MLLITIFVELRVVGGSSRTRACCAVALGRTVCARHGKCESDTAALCKSNGKDILNP